MSKIGTKARAGTFHACVSAAPPEKAYLIAFGNVAAFKGNSCLWSDGGYTPGMRKKAKEGRLAVRVYVSADDSTVQEFNASREDYFPIDISVVVDGWNCKTHGLIYTDNTFEKEINRLFKEFNIPGEVSYTEQGMQGDNYVSMSTHGDAKFLWWFIANYGEKFGFSYIARRKFMDDTDNAIKQVITTLQLLRVGARQIKSKVYTDAILSYAKPMRDVIKGLRDDYGWVRTNKSNHAARMTKGKMGITIYRAGKKVGPRIYVNCNW